MELAQFMVEKKAVPAAEGKKRFVEYFSIIPSRVKTAL
jgi:hypothetical protein